MPNLDFSAIRGEVHTFTDADGAKYEFVSRVDFGPRELMQFNELQRKYNSAQKQWTKNKQSTEAVAGLLQLLDDIVQMLLPKLPRERIRAFSGSQKMALMEFWAEHNVTGPKAQTQAPASAPKTKRPGRR